MAEQINPEQLKALQEKIKNMSPEELKEFQKKQCIFCQIVAGKIQAKKIFEDEHVLAILDINPANPGHTLLLTKEHYSIMPQIPDEELAHVFMVAKSLSNSMLKSIDAHGTNVIVANGIAAGQRAQHFMVHIIPRKENDGIDFMLPQKPLEQGEIETIGDKIVSALAGGAERAGQPETAMPIPPKKQLGQKIAQGQQEKAEDKGSAKSGIDLDDISRLLGAK
ncbi:HIT domain-containing protein [Candidatus Pacearchaeota archaeon]|nr:HIT domain-containing protein [Candidatus Pacearchaeota archaeon]